MKNLSIKKHANLLGAFSLSFFAFSSALQAAPVKWNPYGFIKANVIGATNAMDSFGNANLSAPTSARPLAEADSQRSRHSFQVAQTRFGVRAELEKLTGTLEFDLIDFGKASPTTRAFPRVRLAKIDYKTNEHNTFIMGQDWDVFSPSKPFTYNFVGLYFEAGNAGFMRQQFKWDYQNDGWRSIVAVGLLAANNNAADSAIEKNSYPTLAYRLSKGTKVNELGMSAIGSGVKTAEGRGYRAVYGVSVFDELHPSSNTEVRTEFYWGQNLNSAGTLTLVSPNATISHHEWGGFLSGTANFCERFGVLGGAGAAFVVNKNGAQTDAATFLYIKKNFKQELGFEYRPEENLKIFIQDSFYQTHYTTSLSDQPTAYSNVVEMGMILNI